MERQPSRSSSPSQNWRATTEHASSGLMMGRPTVEREYSGVSGLPRRNTFANWAQIAGSLASSRTWQVCHKEPMPDSQMVDGATFSCASTYRRLECRCRHSGLALLLRLAQECRRVPLVVASRRCSGAGCLHPLPWLRPLGTSPQVGNKGRSIMYCTRAQRVHGPLTSRRNSSGMSGGGTMMPNHTVNPVAASSAATASWWPNGVAASATTTASADGTLSTTNSSKNTPSMAPKLAPNSPT
jgi:hypothetical protein